MILFLSRGQFIILPTFGITWEDYDVATENGPRIDTVVRVNISWLIFGISFRLFIIYQYGKERKNTL